MNANWEIKKLGDIITLQRGHDLPSQARKHGQIPIMGSSGITGYHNQFKAKGPGVIIGRSGNSMGQVSYVSENYWPLNTCLYVTDFKGNCPEFIYYFLKQINFEQFNSGSAQKSLNRNAVYPFEVKFPTSYKIQSTIASILFALENKIKLNQEINQTLEQMAQALFKSWFIDFEPVKAKIAVLEAGGSQEDATLAAMIAISGKDADSLAIFELEHLEKYAELRATAELFPSVIQNSEQGEIPEGWGISTIGDTYSVVMGQSPKGETYNEDNEGTLFFQGRAEFGWRYPSPRLFTTDPKRMAKKGSILLSVRAPVGDLNIAMTECCIGRGLASLIHKSESTSFSYYQLNNLRSIFSKFNGEGTVFGSINQKDLKSIKIISPSEEVISSFTSNAGFFDLMILNLSKEILALQQLRDVLLPRLLSGEITLSEAEELVKEADYV